MKIIATVPTYNRPQMLIRNIECLMHQTYPLDKIVIIDNASSSETWSTLKNLGYLQNSQIQYVKLDENVGASGGFATGVNLAIKNKADWIWLMDDDAFPEKNALSIIVATELDPMTCYWSNCDKDTDS